MGIYPFIYRTGSVLKDILRKNEVYKNLRRLKEEQYLERSKLEQLQVERLTKLVRHANENSKYYGKLLREHNINANDLNFDMRQFRAIPPLTRDLLQANLNEILVNSPGEGLYLNSSGGSTGQPVNFYQDKSYALASEYHNLFFWSWMGVGRGDKTAIFWGADRDYKDWKLKDKIISAVRREMVCNSFHMDDGIISQFIEQLNKFKPKYIYGYASSLFLVAEKIQELGLELKFIPKAISSSAEMLYPHQREKIEAVFGARIFNFYGSREINNIAVECECHNGLHVNASSRFVEILDENNSVLPPGEVGYVAVTDLTNFSFPFIRYLNGDMASMSEKTCGCGRGFPLIDEFQGRSSDFIVTKDQLIHGEYFTHIFYARPEVEKFQLIQEAVDRLTLLLVPKAAEENLRLMEYRKIITDKVGDDIEIKIKVVPDIPLTATGKYRFTISKVKP